MKKGTICVHSGTHADSSTKGICTPIYPSSSYEYMDLEENVYPRYYNTPNQKAIIAKLCALEKAEDGIFFSSGMAAISTCIFALLKQGDHIVLQKDIYGGTHHFATAEFDRFGIAYDFADNDLSNIQARVRENTRVIYIETPSNPLLLITDIEAIADFARSKGLLTIIDNTFATPINQTPIDLGIDVVIHSGTKYIGGHSDICCGAAVASKSLVEKIKTSASNFGGTLNALTCYLIERSLKTLGIRVDRQNQNALAIARKLAGKSEISAVYYPGLESHPGYDVASRQMHAFGAMLSFELDTNRVDTHRFLRRLQLIRPALSLGGVETTVCAPAVTSHAKISDAERAQLGITDGLLRLSVGIEDPDDILADIEQAFGK